MDIYRRARILRIYRRVRNYRIMKRNKSELKLISFLGNTGEFSNKLLGLENIIVQPEPEPQLEPEPQTEIVEDDIIFSD